MGPADREHSPFTHGDRLAPVWSRPFAMETKLKPELLDVEPNTQELAYEAVGHARQLLAQRCSPPLDERTQHRLAQIVCDDTLSRQVREEARRILLAARET